MLFWRLPCDLILIITCIDIAFCLNYSDRLKEILLNNKHFASKDNVGIDSVKYQAEEWPVDDQRDEDMAQSDCSNPTENPIGQTEVDTHSISKSHSSESSSGLGPLDDNDGDTADLNEIKTMAWKILNMTEHIKELNNKKHQNGDAP
jgi:hypothetical protein